MRMSFSTVVVALLFLSTLVFAQNPIVQNCFTADPAPMVHNGTVYLFTSHDEDSTVNNFFTMYDWRCFSSTDMVNWTDHGAVASLKSFSWHKKTNGAWAPQCVERNGKFYLYVPIHGEGIAVLVSDSPTGPFTDPLGKRLVDSDHIWQDIDPTVFVDDNGKAYLYWGNPKLWYVKLNKDMISYDRSVGENGIISVEMTPEAFGAKTGRDGKPGTTYTEGPWFYKRNNMYYMIYAAEGIPEYISYSTAPTAEGPWTYKGHIMKRADHLAFTNHAGIIDFKGNSYIFYHNQSLSGQGFKRSVSVEQFSYNADGSIPLITPTKEGVIKSRVVEDGGTGAYPAIMYTERNLATHTIFRPKDLSSFGENAKLPIIAWGNGACANSPWEHVNFLSEVASHGFLVIAIGPMPQEGERGKGRSTSSQLIDAIDWAIAQNNNKLSVFYGKIDVSKIAVSGMSCGGLQALETAPDPRVTTTVVCNSGIIGNPGGGMPGMPGLTKDHLAKLHTPTLYLLGGEKDIAYNNGMDDYKRINHVPVFMANMDVGHGGTYGQPHGGEFAKVATAWYKWQLKGDEEAGKMFTGNPCGLSKSTVWKAEKKNLP